MSGKVANCTSLSIVLLFYCSHVFKNAHKLFTMARAIRMPLVAVIALGIAYLLCVSVSLRRASTVVRYLDQHIRLQMDLPHFVTTTTAKTATATGTPDLEGIGGASGVESLSEEEVGDKQKEEGGDAEEEDVSMPLAVHTNIKHNPDDLMELPPESKLFIPVPNAPLLLIILTCFSIHSIHRFSFLNNNFDW